MVAEDEESAQSVGIVQPKDLATFLVEVHRILRVSTPSDSEHAAMVKVQAEEYNQLGQSIFTNPTAIDEMTYSKGGITSTIEYEIRSYFSKPCR
jgi:hypothetical protein